MFFFSRYQIYFTILSKEFIYAYYIELEYFRVFKSTSRCLNFIRVYSEAVNLSCDEPHTYPLYLGQGLEFNSSKLKTPD